MSYLMDSPCFRSSSVPSVILKFILYVNVYSWLKISKNQNGRFGYGKYHVYRYKTNSANILWLLENTTKGIFFYFLIVKRFKIGHFWKNSYKIQKIKATTLIILITLMLISGGFVFVALILFYDPSPSVNTGKWLTVSLRLSNSFEIVFRRYNNSLNDK